MLVPSGYVPLLEAVENVATDIDPDAMKATKPADVEAWEKWQRVAAAGRAAVRAEPISPIGSWPSRSEPATSNYDRLSPARREAVDRMVIAMRSAAAPLTDADGNRRAAEWGAIEERKKSARETARGKLLQALADGDVTARLRDADGYSWDIPPEPWCGSKAGLALLLGTMSCRLPGYTGTVSGRVEVLRAGFNRWRTQRQSPAVSSIGAERRLENWLTDRMREAPDAPIPKAVMKDRAAAEAGLEVPERAFDRAWIAAAGAAPAPLWVEAGRRKSRQ
jgi:hypothetical protein